MRWLSGPVPTGQREDPALPRGPVLTHAAGFRGAGRRLPKLRFELIRYSPGDLRFIVRAISVLFAWKWVSVDFAALPKLVHGPSMVPVSPPGSWFVGVSQRALADHVWTLRLVQIAGAVAIVAGTLLLRRSLMLIGVVLVLALLVAASPFNGPLFEIEQPAVLLAIVAFWPGSWRAFKGDGPSTQAATLLGVALATYMGGAYLLAGFSKIEFDDLWIEHVRLDLLYPAMTVWHSATLPGWLDSIAFLFHRLFESHRLLAESAAAGALVAELTWWLSIFTPAARYTVPALMAGTHLMIFLTSGILFAMMALLGLIVIWTPAVRGRLIRRGGARVVTRSSPAAVPWRGLIPAVAAVSALLLWPAVSEGSYHVPFADFKTFGWSYGGVAQPNVEYRLGIVNPRTRRLEPLPMNHGGFLDFRMLSAPGGLVAGYLGTSDPRARGAYRALLLQYANAIRPYESNGWLLGPLAFPSHVVAVAPVYSPDAFERIYLIENRFVYEDRRLRDTGWKNRGLFALQRGGSYHLSSTRTAASAEGQ